MQRDSIIYVAGHKGMVGSAIVKRLTAEGFSGIITRTHAQLDLTIQADVNAFFEKYRPEVVFLAAARNGGIRANIAAPAQFLYENLMIESNVIHASFKYGAKKVIFTASVYAYPCNAQQPIKESALLTGKPEETSEGYAIAKIVGIELCKLYNKQYGVDFISAVLPHIYGYNDNFDPENSTVLPALIRKFHTAKCNNAPYVELWGSGKPMREFLFIDDLVDALMFLADRYSGEALINIGAVEEVSILELANIIKDVSGYKGEIRTDISKPDGVYRNKLDSERLYSNGWRPKVSLYDGVRKTYEWFSHNEKELTT